MKLLKFEKQHHEMISNWWKEHNHPIIPLNMLSPFGLISYNEKNEPTSACFVYFVEGCDIAQLSWAVTNPSVSPRERYNGLDFCIKGLIGVAKANNRTNILSFSGYRSLNKIFGKNGLKELKDHKLYYTKVGVL